MACRASPAPPQFRPGTKPLGRTGGFDAGEARLEDLTKRRRLTQSCATSSAWPSLWSRVAVAGQCRRGRYAGESRNSRGSQSGPSQAHADRSKSKATPSPPRPAWWIGAAAVKHKQRRPRLGKNSELLVSLFTRSPIPSPPRPAGRGEGGEEDATSGPPAPRSCADEARLHQPPDPPRSRPLPLPPSPPRPARERNRKAGSTDAREQETAEELLGGVAATSSTNCSDHRSKKATTTSPIAQIPPGSRAPRPGIAPKLPRRGAKLLLATTRRPSPLHRPPPPALTARKALDRPDKLPTTLKAL
jgi:hypothetical protein